MSCVRWSAGGCHLLYVHGSDDGALLGYLDLDDGDTPYIELPERAEEFQATVTLWNHYGRPASLPNHARLRDTIGTNWVSIASNEAGVSIAGIASINRRVRVKSVAGSARGGDFDEVLGQPSRGVEDGA